MLHVTSDSGTSSADLMGPAGRLYVVNIIEQDDGSYRADKTFAEIAGAVEEGRVVLCRVAFPNEYEIYGYLALYSSQVVSFSTYMEFGILPLRIFYHISADDRVTITYPDKDTAEMPYLVRASKSDTTITVTATYSDFRDEVTVLELDENGVPVSVTKDGDLCTLQWEGFDG